MQIGLLPVVGGVFVVYKYLFNIKNKLLYMYISLAISVTLLLWFRLIQPSLGFIILSVCLCILSGPAYVFLIRYFKKTRISHFASFFTLVIWLLIIPLMIMPTLYLAAQKGSLSPPVYDAMVWLQTHTPEDSVVLAAPHEGHALAALSHRKTVIDDYFLLTKNADERLNDVTRAFTTPFATEAAKLFGKYDVDYVFFSKEAKAAYSITDLAYKDEDCMSEVYNQGGIVIFNTRCRIKIT